MNWRFRSSERPLRDEDEAGFRPSRRFLRPESGRSSQRSRLSRVITRLGPRFWKGLEVIVLLVAALILGQMARREIARMSNAHYFLITDLIVEGNRVVPTATIIDSLGLSNRVSIMELDLDVLSRRIMSNPWIKTASISRRLPATLVIRVAERTPRSIVMADRGYLVSEDGLVLKEVEPQELPGLPLLGVRSGQSLHEGGRVDSPRLEQGARVWQLFHAHNPASGVQATEIRLESDGSFTVLLGRGMPFLRLREETMQAQMKRLDRVLQLRGISLDRLEYADLRFSDKVIVKPLPKEGEV